MKKKIMSVSIAAVTSLSIVGGAYYFNGGEQVQAEEEANKFREFGSLIKETIETEEVYTMKAQSTENEVLDADKYQLSVAFYENLAENVPEGKEEELALEQLVSDTAILNKARELGIQPTEAQIKDRVSEIKRQYEDPAIVNDPEMPQNKEVVENLKSVIEGSGLTYEEYWNSYIPANYEVILSTENLFEYVTKDIKEEDKKQEKWAKFTAELANDFKNTHGREISEFKKQN